MVRSSMQGQINSVDGYLAQTKLFRPFRENAHDRRLFGRYTDKMDGWNRCRNELRAHAGLIAFAIRTLVATDSRTAAQSLSLIHCLAASQEPPTAITFGSSNQLSRLFRLIPPVGTNTGENARNVAANIFIKRIPPISSAGKNLQAVIPRAKAPWSSDALAMPGK